MKDNLLMAIDLGTSFIKTAVFDRSGKKLAEAREAVKSEQPADGIFLQHGEDLMDAVYRCMKTTADTLGDRKHEVAAIGFTGQMAGFMGVDSEWNDVTGWSCSLDTRYIPYAEAQMQKYADDFYRISGTNSPLFSSKYEWFRREFPDAAAQIAKYLMISGYVIGKLGDLAIEDAVIDGSLITWTGLADVQNRSWSKKLCDELGIDMHLLPRITESSEVVAHLSPAAAERTGLSAGIPMVSGAGDKIAGCVGAGCLEPGEILLEAASFGAISCRTEAYEPDPQRGYDLLNGHRSGMLYAHYYMPGSGITLEWFLNSFYRRENETAAEAYARLDREMAEIPAGSDHLFAVGMLAGTVMPLNGDLRGVFLGASWSHTPAHFYRALCESFAFAVKNAIDRINAVYPQYADRKVIRMIGGGAESAVQAQIYADVLGLDVEIMEQKDAALYGACLLAAEGVGLKTETGESYPVRAVIHPDSETSAVYQNLCERYRRYIDLLTPLCREVRN